MTSTIDRPPTVRILPRDTDGPGDPGDPTDAPDRTVLVDPRFRQRRIEVRKQAGRRRLKRLLILVLVAAVSLATVIVLRSPILDVDRVVVDGTVRTPVDTVLEAAGVEVGAPILLADLDGARSAIESLPWVERAEVRRDLPGDVVIHVVEREPAAVVGAPDGPAVVVDALGHVLSDVPEAAAPPYVHVVTGEAVPDIGGQVAPSLSVAVDLASRLRANPAGVVSAVVVEPSLRLQMISGGLVELGDAEALDDKLEAFRTVQARVDQTCLAVLDLRVPTHPVLTRDPAC